MWTLPRWVDMLSNLPTVKHVRRRIVKCRMHTNPVIIGINIHEHRLSYLHRGMFAVQGFPFPFQGLENDSAQALSQQFPFRLML
jgi:hypothetical protein